MSLTLALISCSKDEEPAKINDPAAATTITLLMGSGQTAEVETALTNPVEVIVKDQNGDPIAGSPVNFKVNEGSISTATAKTDSAGKVSVDWTLGTSVGVQTLTIIAFKAGGTTPLNGSPLSNGLNIKRVSYCRKYCPCLWRWPNRTHRNCGSKCNRSDCTRPERRSF